MGYRDGEFVFIHGFGSGPFGLPYDSSKPQGQVYGPAGCKPVPFWCRDLERRELTLLHYMEWKARVAKEQSSSYEGRLFVVTLKLAEVWVRGFQANEKRRNVRAFNRIRYVKKGKRKRKVPILSVYTSCSAWLRATEDFPAFLKKIVDDYFPSDDNGFHWDLGQIAHNKCGGSENKSRVPAHAQGCAWWRRKRCRDSKKRSRKLLTPADLVRDVRLHELQRVASCYRGFPGFLKEDRGRLLPLRRQWISLGLGSNCPQ